MNWSATTLKPLTGDVNNTDHLITTQCSAGKPWVLAFMWMPLDTHHPSKHCCEPSAPPHHNNTTWWQCPPPANTAQKQLEAHNKAPKVSTGPPNSPDLNLIDHHLWNVLEQVWSMDDPTPQHIVPRGSTIKRPGAIHHRTSSEVLSPCLDRLELFWLHKGNLHNIRQVVIMLCLSGYWC